MTEFNSIDYHKNQIQKQYGNEMKTIHKTPLNFQPFSDELSKLSEKKYNKIHILVNGTGIEGVQQHIKNQNFSYVDLLMYYLKRIQDEDHRYNSVLFLNPKALAEAKNKIYSKGNHLIYGMPILVKGNIGVKGLPLSAGSAALKNNIAKRDSQLIKGLKEKGAIILGQTNLSEFANYMTTNSSNGYSAVGGQTKNPHGNFDVGGSSAGSAVAMAMGFAAATIGTETAGSIIYPANQNGVIGLKPTLGSVPQDLIVPISKTHDIAGPMTNNAKDQWILYDVMKTQPFNKPNFSSDFLSNVKIGIIINEEITETFRASDHYFLEKTKNKFLEKGANLEKIELNEKLFSYDINEVLSYEFKEEINNFLNADFEDAVVKSLDEIVSLNESDLDNNAPYGQDLLHASQQNNCDIKDIEKLINIYRHETSEIFKEAFEKYDFLLTISNYMTTPYACAGNPAINFPVGFRKSGEPIGCTLIADKSKETHLIAAIHAFLS